MANIFTNDFGVLAADSLEQSVNSDKTFFAFAAKSTEYDNDAIVPEPGTSYGDEVYKIHDEMLFAKAIESTDVARVIRNNAWESDTVYTPFTDRMQDRKTNKYFVATQEGTTRSVFICLDNNNGSVSVNAPMRSQLDPSDTLYRMSDGYVWKFIMSVPDSIFNKFGSSRYIPIIPDDVVANNAVVGAIDVMTIDIAGQGYNVDVTGNFNQVEVGGNTRKHYIEGTTLASNTDFYNGSAIYITENSGRGQHREIIQYGEENGKKFVLLDEAYTFKPTASSKFVISPNVKVIGDGSGVRARAVIDANNTSIKRIDIYDRGSNYTFASATVQGNSGVLDANGASVFSSIAVVNPVIPPAGGLGKNQKHDLSANKICFSSTFVGDEVPVTKFRKIGIIVNPILDSISIRVANTDNFTQDMPVTTSDGIEGIVTDATPNENILVISSIQGTIKANTTIQSSANDSVNTNIIEVVTDISKFDQRTRLDLSSNVAFTVGEKITTSNSSVFGYVDQSENNTLYLTETRGNFNINTVISGEQSGASATISNTYPRHIRDNSGNVIYVENMLPVTRSANTTEHLKMVMEF